MESAFAGAERVEWRDRFPAAVARCVLVPLQVLFAATALLFLAALTAMLLRHPQVEFFPIDRLAFGVLILVVVGRAMVQRQPLLVVDRALWPMIGLTALALGSLVGQPYDAEAWSVLASKFVVPFTLFYLAGLVFTEEKAFRRFEGFALLVLAYLSFTAIAFLLGARSLIFPRYILDESLGFQPDRARGPFLQSVANGVSLNLLGLIALHAYRRGRLRGWKALALLASIPVAILATMTRAVWLSFVGSAVALTFIWNGGARNLPWRRAFVGLLLVAGIGAVIAVGASSLGSSDLVGALTDRLQERGPVDYREAVYAGGWEMFLQRPLTGWGFHQMPGELPRHVSGYREKILYPHNTYLELLVEHGVAGLALYVWLMWELWRLGRGPIPDGETCGFLDRQLHRLWPILLIVYWINAALVVMSYQFVNGLLFTMAGMLAAQRRRAEAAC